MPLNWIILIFFYKYNWHIIGFLNSERPVENEQWMNRARFGDIAAALVARSPPENFPTYCRNWEEDFFFSGARFLMQARNDSRLIPLMPYRKEAVASATRDHFVHFMVSRSPCDRNMSQAALFFSFLTFHVSWEESMVVRRIYDLFPLFRRHPRPWW